MTPLVQLDVIDMGADAFTANSQHVTEEEKLSHEENEEALRRKKDEEARIVEALRRSCRNSGPGFFYLRMSEEEEKLAAKALACCRRFFTLSDGLKRDLTQDVRHFYRYNGVAIPGSGPGYRARGEDPNFLQDRRESYLMGRSERDVGGAHADTPWPPESLLPGFREDCEAYMRALEDRSARLRRALAEALGAEQSAFDDMFREGTWLLGFNHYVAHRSPDEGDRPDLGECGIAPHQDDGLFTLLHTDGQRGLQICPEFTGSDVHREEGMRSKDLKWVDVVPRDKHWIVNLGTLMTRMSGGRYRSTLHRVVNSGDSNIGERFSVRSSLSLSLSLSLLFRLCHMYTC